ncbi:HD domain-containing protein [Lachnospiraceae bacterium 42-17]|jgi:HD superfamily phosphohydrolase YqeK|nr:HD domain-containing protein [Dorea sp.]
MNLQYAKQQFELYLDNYDREDDKVKLKIIHTYGVVDCILELAGRIGLTKEERELAGLIGLLHDIGRFEQLKRYDSFEPDTMDHAAFGAEILFKEGMIRIFIKEDRWDSVIRTAIERHSDFKLEGISHEHMLLHARLIRDADKLDNCRVKLEDAVETMLGVTAREVGRTEISTEVMEQFLRKESILSSLRRTKMDYWLSYLAYFFDINFRETLDIIREKNYVNRLIDRIPYSNQETKKRMDTVRKMLNAFVRETVENK